MNGLTKQKIRKLMIIISMLLFPVSMVYFSPGMVFRGARLGILSGSYITFFLLFVSSIFWGRSWCAWFCPAGGIGEVMQTINPMPYNQHNLKKIKYIVWSGWLIAIMLVALFIGHGFSKIDPLLGTQYGISTYNIALLGVYYGVIFIVVMNALLFGKRGFCHTLCWMAPFMVLGRKLGNKLSIKALYLTNAAQTPCSNCQKCEKKCPMSLPITSMLQNENMEHPDCILCGECVDACKQDKLSIRFKRLN